MKPLRPIYTALLLKELEKQSLNVYGGHGQGQMRLLEDLQTPLQGQRDVVFLGEHEKTLPRVIPVSLLI